MAKKKAPSEPTIATFTPIAGVLKALADPSRLRIIFVLSGGSKTSQQIIESIGDLAQPTVSHHLAVLRRAGLVTSTRDGVWSHNSIDADAIRRVAGFVSGIADGEIFEL